MLIYIYVSMYICIFQKQWKDRWIVQALDQGAVEGAIDVPSDGSGARNGNMVDAGCN